MSRKSTAEYIAAKRKRYLCANKAKRSRILDEVQETTGFPRKYVTNLLNGNIRYHTRKGRGKSYGPNVAATLADIWREAGCPCAPYLQADIGMWLDEYEQYVANINKGTKDPFECRIALGAKNCGIIRSVDFRLSVLRPVGRRRKLV